MKVAAVHTIKLVTQWVASFRISSALTHHGVTLCPTVFTSLLISWISQASVTPVKSDMFSYSCFQYCSWSDYFLYWKKGNTSNSFSFFFVTKQNYLFHYTPFLTVQLDFRTNDFYQSFSLSDLVSFRWKIIKLRKELIWNIYPCSDCTLLGY